ncbi:MAG: UDP-N-acetylglucosamine--N-acetylmuramyl-(pentapeptide) pyrophosphoryl-undecaprenol N-acetylglucosamine transferase [Planctomycetia bacterium]|nr:UDP-N-acetylglucosamine--N-acetylmuramyl-(pentapeptide) pyrophosphoryl-undecaprenol N-acetylglucosamine transferase [Planctomycetia bacterium]
MSNATNNRLRVVFAGGVTGGHLYPGLAVAEQLVARDPTVRVAFAGPGSAFERAAVTKAGFDYVPLTCPRSPRRLRDVAHFGRRMFGGYRTAAAYLASQRVSAVVALGGYASVPMALAAVRRKVPLVLLEQNAVIGRANRWLARFAAVLCLPPIASSNPAAARRFGRCSIIVTGTPVRACFAEAAQSGGGASPSRDTLLILGGSGGARLLNEAVPKALAPLRRELATWRVVHQTGAADQSATSAAYRQAGIAATVVPFIDEVASTLARTRLAICRAGGSTLAELAVTGVPAMLVPLAGSADDHQRRNALAYAAAGASGMIESTRLGVEAVAGNLAQELSLLLPDAPRQETMSRAMTHLARPDAAALSAKLVMRMAREEHTMALSTRQTQ